MAQTALNDAKSAHEAAIARDTEAAKAAATAGLPPPTPTARSFEQDIDDASRQLRRAQQAYEDARDEAEHAARVAAASLHRASREGIHNKPWWRHVLRDAGHWTHAAWVGTLRFVSKVAVTVSAVAGLAALVLSVAGLFFAPLEVAAGALETVSFAAGSIALASQAALAITGDASWVSVGLDALALLPAVGSKGTRALAGRLRQLKISRNTAGSAKPVEHVGVNSRGAGPVNLPKEHSWGAPQTLADHLARHGADFGTTSADTYADTASEFLQHALKRRLPVKIDEKGIIRVYDPSTNTFGSYNADGTTKTLYKPDTAKHRRSTNWAYWLDQPGKDIGVANK